VQDIGKEWLAARGMKMSKHTGQGVQWVDK
jgi:hypothetical protein